MKLKDDYKDSPTYIQNFGYDLLAEAEAAAEQATSPDCPFCGKQGVIVLGNLYGKNYAGVQCSCCGIHTTPVFTGFNLSRKALTITDAINVSVKAWSRRP